MSKPVVQDEDTDRHAAIQLKHLSPTWVKCLDNLLGESKARNGGYMQVEVKFERGKVRWFDLLQRYLSW